ncbi:hypothetical protein LCH33_003860 [Pseudomonas amygdali]|uniref:hypothetical protein n=1 Tax=Pseudomonas amygdali TaxID=47877 RepID=UPI001CD90170|nr:hypothetical protein [Pseudomonas amygdali]UBT80437.1 hypothetical protein LCH33_003860 [Pseudomonas amygdali]
MSITNQRLGKLRWLLWATVASSVLHYADNLLFFHQYPEPPWINRHMIDAFWWLMTPLAWIGYRMMRRSAHRAGAATLLAYAGCNLLTLGHYRYAPIHEISLRIHTFILIEAALAVALIAYLLITYPKRSIA